VAAIAAGVWGCVGPSPPPTPPGANLGFDRHLAELDPRYRQWQRGELVVKLPREPRRER
jgi:hypothetical protein